MKILITTDWYSPVINGVVTSVINLKKELEERGHEVRILTLSSQRCSYVEKDVYYIKSFNIDKIYPNARVVVHHKDNIIEEIIEWKPDIIHSQCEFMTFPYAIKIRRQCECPLLHTYHTVYEDYTHYFSPNKTLGRKVVAIWSKHLLKKTKAVIVPTIKGKQILNDYQIHKPVHVIPTGIDLRKYAVKLSETRKKELKENLGIPLHHKVLVNIGRLAREKNLDEMLEYIKKRNRSDISLLLVGDGPYRHELGEKVKSLQLEKQVIFAGMVAPEDVPAYYQLGDVFVSASNSETQGLTYVEALASGVPALCRQDVCLEGLVLNGYNGFQYETYELFHKYLDYILEDEERRLVLAEQAIKSTLKYSTSRFGDDMEQLYFDTVNSSLSDVFRNHLSRVLWIPSIIRK